MRELIKGVTKIKWIGSAIPEVEYSLWKHKEGIYIGKEMGLHRWLSPLGVEFNYGNNDTLFNHDGDVDHEFSEVSHTILPDNNTPTESPVKSTGGASSYYKIQLPQWLLDKQSNNGFIMLEDLAEVLYKNDFNYVNVFKAQKRMFELEQGAGKCGNTLEYDATKCKYYVDKQVEVFNRKGE